jgi:two-component system, chemotaxis family, sensor kinase CheA
LIDLVGELVTIQAHLAEKSSSINNTELTGISEEFERLIGSLRDETMNIRMVEIGSSFSTFKRLVRDLSQKLGKKINFNTSGGETELDKTVVEKLKDPLVHILRNSLDHGIESEEIRIAAGKLPEGNISIAAAHLGSQVHIAISDDGKGLSTDFIKRKALEKGIITPDQDLTESEIFQLIFAAGFSTADQVSDLSGRGVGMDVVRQNIENLRGSIELKSEVGVGTTITLKLPLTLAIIDGLMFNLGNDFYIFPLSVVEECLEIKSEEINRVSGRNIINLRGDAIPYVIMRDKFDVDSPRPELEQIIITRIGDKRIGFVVDKVIGSHQTVIKSLGKALKNSEYISGATILGDGTLALIVQVHKLI